MYDFDQIVRIVASRQRNDSPLITKLIEMRNRYNGDFVILPFADVEEAPSMPSLAPHLISEAIDDAARRAASVMPMIDAFPTRPGVEASLRKARSARGAVGATFHEGKFQLVRRRYYRHLAGYATTALVVAPTGKDRHRSHSLPVIEIKDPLTTYPAPQAPEDTSPPCDVAFVTSMSAGAVRAAYPKARAELGGPVGDEPSGMNEMWSLVEWIDADQWLIGLLGPTWPEEDHRSWDRRQHETGWMQLKWWPNRAGMPVAVCPRRVTMDKIASQIANMTGRVDLMDKLMALDIIAQERAIFPDRYILAEEGNVPRIVGGRWQDGREGQTNLIEGAKAIGELRATPDMRTGQVIDRLERDFRISAGLVPQAGGETYGALRTGRGIDALMGAAVDLRIQELHEISESFLPHLAEAVIATYKGYWPNKRFVLISGWKGARGRVEFTPSKDLEAEGMLCAYPITGSDISMTGVALSQMRAAKAISQSEFRRLHPWIEDPDSQEHRVLEEDLEEAFKTGLMQKIVEGGMPLEFVAFVEEYVRTEECDIFTAFRKANEAMKKLQAQAPPPTPEGMANPPELMPGMQDGAQAMPGMPPGAPPADGPAGMSAALAPGMTGPSPGQADIRRALLAFKANAGIS